MKSYYNKYLECKHFGFKDKEEEFIKSNYQNMTYTEIGNILNKTEKSISEKSRRLGLHKNYIYNENYFKNWNHEMSYILGFICSDGCVQITKQGSYRLSISQQGIDILEKIKSIMLCGRIRKQREKYYLLCLDNKTIVKDLINMGITPRKSLTLKFPKIPPKFIGDFIRGDFDGDGCITGNKNLCASFYGSKYFILELKEVLISKKIKCYTFPIKSIWGLGIKRTDSLMRLFHLMYNNSTLFLERKYQKFSQIKNQYERVNFSICINCGNKFKRTGINQKRCSVCRDKHLKTYMGNYNKEYYKKNVNKNKRGY